MIADDEQATGKPAAMGKHGRRGRVARYGGVWNTLPYVRGNGSQRLLASGTLVPDAHNRRRVSFSEQRVLHASWLFLLASLRSAAPGPVSLRSLRVPGRSVGVDRTAWRATGEAAASRRLRELWQRLRGHRRR